MFLERRCFRLRSMSIRTRSVDVKRSRSRVVLAWAAVLVLSLPPIVWRELRDEDEPWSLRVATVAALAALLSAAHIRPAWRPIRPFMLAMVALGAGVQLVGVVFASEAWEGWSGDNPWPLVQLAEVSVPLVMVGFLALTLIGSGLRREDVFLAKGDPDAPVRNDPEVPGFEPGISWRKAMLGWSGFLPFFLGIVVVVSLLQIGFDLGGVGQAVVWLPVVVVAAAINAIREEVTFRTVLLARLEAVVGSAHAVWITAAAFGLGHFYGMPRGVPGVLLAGFLGLIFAKCILETRGLVLALVAHFLADAILYFFEAMTP